VFDQEIIDYLLVDETGRTQLTADIPDGARAWADAQFENLRGEHRINADRETEAIVRVVLALAARGEAVIVGRGAGFVLPTESTLHVRVVAPFESRVGYIAQALRLSHIEAASEVRHRDARRTEFLTRTLLREPPEATAYDLVVNSSRLGVEGAAQFIGWAVRTKQQFTELGELPEAAGIDDLTES
jgi:cytidylate kinase